MTITITPAFIVDEIEETYPDINTEHVVLDAYMFVADEMRFPFLTIITGDTDDPFSNLGRSGVFRLSIKISVATFQSLFGTAPIAWPTADANESGFDFAALDTLMPHPVHGRNHWVAILNPSAETFAKLRPLIDEAVEIASDRVARQGNSSGVRYMFDPSEDPSGAKD